MTLPLLIDARLTVEDRVAVLQFCRDDVRNALTGTGLLDDLLTTLDWVKQTPELQVLIITGSGRSFSAGGNVKQMRDRVDTFAGTPLEIAQRYKTGIQRMTRAMVELEIPVIAAINGVAVGAGFDLACMCDLRLASQSARMGETFINLGLIAGDGGAYFFTRLVGHQKAAEMALTGCMLDAEQARQAQLVLSVVPDDQLMSQAKALAATMAAQPPVALRLTKRLLKASDSPLDRFLDMCATYQGLCHHTLDHAEALAAFFEKRPGRYRGC